MQGPSVSIRVGMDPPVFVPWSPGITLRSALEEAYDRVPEHRRVRFAIEYFGRLQREPLGYMLIMVDRVYNLAGQAPFFWKLVLNGVPTPRGIDFTVLDDGDVVTLLDEPILIACP
jgi:hypothetical protein